MDKILRATAISGSRKLPKEVKESAGYQSSESATKNEVTIKTKSSSSIQDANCSQNAQYAEEMVSNKSTPELSSTIDSSVIEALKAENKKLQETCSTAKKNLEKKTQELENFQISVQDNAFKKGVEAGKEEGQRLFSEKLSELDKLLSSLTASARGDIAKLDLVAVEIAFAALCRIVELKIIDKEFVLSTVRNVLDQVKEDLPVNIHVSQKHYDLIKDSQSDLNNVFTAYPLQIVADSRVSLGGCIVETEEGSWDARLEKQLQRLKDTLVTTATTQKGVGF